ncbi:hypothetical protein Y032_0006g2819 [Ancylostoma ceylanicum]|uniref:SXP/RAL-2 family protein Ani s 5-like cation-binding domain-containing protein n=1 Tax=Ancylostoma ceylanicum TaxID=53326 RepID=A0A016VNK4_9BILA|nr:hypothetical protein Y032_0006g2819 [Ancylostoma ceylanicum]
MFDIIILCTVVSHILARPVPDSHDIASSLVKKPDDVATDQEIEDFVAMLKIMRDTSVAKEKRVEDIVAILKRNDENLPRKSVEDLLDLADDEWKSVHNASPKVKDAYNKTYNLLVDPKFYKMDLTKQKAEVEKIFNALSDSEKKEMEEIVKKTMKKAKELGYEDLPEPLGTQRK